ncbi:MAG: hypothetical protein ABI068_16540 [Ktedonobacterales bacterium]
MLGSIQPHYPHLRYNICAMQAGNFFDTPFDGQSSITARDWETAPTQTSREEDASSPAHAGGLRAPQGTSGAAPAAGPAPLPRITPTFIGVDDHRHTVTGEPLTGHFVALAPWVAPDPITGNPALTLPERRERLNEIARALLPGHPNANAYRESVIWADLPITSAQPDN